MLMSDNLCSCHLILDICNLWFAFLWTIWPVFINIIGLKVPTFNLFSFSLFSLWFLLISTLLLFPFGLLCYFFFFLKVEAELFAFRSFCLSSFLLIQGFSTWSCLLSLPFSFSPYSIKQHPTNYNMWHLYFYTILSTF